MEYTIKPWFKTWWGKLVVILLTIILIFVVAVGFYVYNDVKTAKKNAGANAGVKLSGQTYPAADNDHYWLGSEKAKITIVEFADFGCHHSKNAYPTIRELSLKYKDDVKLIWRDYPVVTEYSALLALGGRCAGEQGLFWPMHDKLFQNQGISTVNELSALANQVGADLFRFNGCLNQQKYLPQIKKDLADGKKFNISGTPTFFINGYKIEGDIPYDILIKIIEELKK